MAYVSIDLLSSICWRTIFNLYSSVFGLLFHYYALIWKTIDNNVTRLLFHHSWLMTKTQNITSTFTKSRFTGTHRSDHYHKLFIIIHWEETFLQYAILLLINQTLTEPDSVFLSAIFFKSIFHLFKASNTIQVNTWKISIDEWNLEFYQIWFKPSTPTHSQ